MDRFDVIVVGLGAMGAAAVWQLARRGVRVLGVDQYSPPHALGSSHGDTRITRLAIGEGAHYSPLAARSHALWREIEAETGADLMTTTGMLLISSSATRASVHVPHFFRNTLEAADLHGVDHERLDADEMRRRFPQFAVADEELGYYEPGAGFLRPEACIEAQLTLARRHGAVIRTGARLQSLAETGGGVRVEAGGQAFEAGRVLLCLGAWLPEQLPAARRGLFTVRRQVLYWFAVDRPELFDPARCPVFIWELPVADRVIYGFPAVDGPSGGVKVATEQQGVATHPRDVDRSVAPSEAAETHRDCIAPFLPAVSDRLIKAAACLYTVTPDAGFVVDRLGDSDRVTVVSACSGHGFKHSAALGEAVADRALGASAPLIDLDAVRWARFGR
ncbi:MAG: N-methyl-L-tryptophan oxidase [Caulobacteraceae bacterium]|nr:N-methyl-L-tryptophan oxidase [Caulobacteraceae bacterium]